MGNRYEIKSESGRIRKGNSYPPAKRTTAMRRTDRNDFFMANLMAFQSTKEKWY
jgi:hypothetical protein